MKKSFIKCGFSMISFSFTLLFLASSCGNGKNMPELEESYLGCAYTTTDGTRILQWETEDRSQNYRLEDGTELLWIEETSPLNYAFPELEALSKEAQENILGYFSQLGRLFDPELQMESAYEDYHYTGEEFCLHVVSQISSPSFSSRYVLAYTTELHIYAGKNKSISSSSAKGNNVLFSCTTGEELSVWDLFLFTESEVKEYLLSLYEYKENPEVSSLVDNMDTPWVTLGQDGIIISHPPSETKANITSVRFDMADVEPILQPWVLDIQPELPKGATAV